MERKKLRVEGIPTDIPTSRAKDKLTIHFLRTRNGGGEVEDIKIFPGPPLHAIVIFEDDKVVDSVLKMKDHFLKINDKTYKLEVRKLSGKLELDEAEDPHPGGPYRGGAFEAYLPENGEGKKLLSLLEKALNQNLTFKIEPNKDGDFVTWHKIPHKTALSGGKSKRGYPDSQYMKNTIALLKTLGIE